VTVALGRPPRVPQFPAHTRGNGPGHDRWPVDPFLGPSVSARIALYCEAPLFAPVSKLAPFNPSPASSKRGSLTHAMDVGVGMAPG
jgi:hypothetical protein